MGQSKNKPGVESIFQIGTDEEELFLTNTYGDKYLYSVNRNTLNDIGATQHHHSRFSAHCQQKDSLFIVIGSDSGTLLNYLNTEHIAQGTQFILIEPEYIFNKIRSEFPLSAFQDNIHFIKDSQFKETAEAIKINKYLVAGSVAMINSLAAEYCFLPGYYDIFYTTQSLCHQIEFLVNVQFRAKPFFRAQLKNISENQQPSTCLFNLFPGKTAILLAGGPSLDEIIPWVVNNQDSLVVLAVSRVCRRLIKANLVPDIIFSIDPHDLSFDVSMEMLKLWEKSLFIHTPHVTSLLLSQWQGKSLYLGHRFPWHSKMNQPNLPMEGPTVSNTALSVAMEMGFNQVILAGVDLCLSKQGYTHASGSNEFEAGPQLTQATKQVVTNGGWMAETTSGFATGIEILHSQAQRALQKNVRFINPARGAAQVEGVEYLPVEKILLSPLTSSASTILNEAVSTLSPEKQIKDLSDTLNELRRVKGQLIHIKKLAQEALQCNEGLFGRKGKKQDFKYKKRMDKIERKLNSTYADCTGFIKNYGAADLLKMTRFGTLEEWTDQDIEESAKTYYSQYIKLAKETLTLIDDSKKRVLSRQEELHDSPDFNQLFSQWTNDHHPGRLLQWLKTHGQTLETLPGGVQEQASSLHQDYLEQFNKSQDSPHMLRSKTFADLKGVQGKLQLFFKQKDKNSLANLIETFTNHSNPQAHQYLSLCNGYMCELENDWDGAIDAYSELFEDQTESTILEEALLRVASLSIQRNDHDNSLLAFELLSSISPVYIKHHAYLLRILGKHQQAISTYLEYVEKIPDDINTMIQIGLYFRDIGIEEGAVEMFNHILSKNPDNITVKNLIKNNSE